MHEFDPTKVTALIQVFPKGDYEFSIGEPKAYQKTNAKGNLTKGVRWGLLCERVVEGDPNMKGEKQFLNGYPSSGATETEGLAFIKRYIMAALGYQITVESEKQFNVDMAGKNWGLDYESGACGDMWRAMTGKRFIVTLDAQPNPEDPSQLQQKFVAVRPLE